MNQGSLFQYMQGGYVLCKLKKKPDVKTNKGEPNHHMFSISDFEAAPNCSIDGDCGPSMELHRTHGYGESSLLDLDFDNPNLDILAPDEVERNSLTVLPLGLENGNLGARKQHSFSISASCVCEHWGNPVSTWTHLILSKSSNIFVLKNKVIYGECCQFIFLNLLPRQLMLLQLFRSLRGSSFCTFLTVFMVDASEFDFIQSVQLQDANLWSTDALQCPRLKAFTTSNRRWKYFVLEFWCDCCPVLNLLNCNYYVISI